MTSAREYDSTAKRDPAPRPRPAQPAGADVQGLLGLQATAGNAAVVQLLQRMQGSATHDVLRRAGRPLSDATRSEMEARLGADLSDVRIHDDHAAQQSAAQLGATAYTSGSHVVIGENGADKHTLAHELTHVIQQRTGPVDGTDNGAGLRVSDPSDRFEREAEANAHAVLSRPEPDVQRSAHEGNPSARSAGKEQPIQRMQTVPDLTNWATDDKSSKAYELLKDGEFWKGARKEIP